jgi:hypothetical protein
MGKTWRFPRVPVPKPSKPMKSVRKGANRKDLESELDECPYCWSFEPCPTHDKE